MSTPACALVILILVLGLVLWRLRFSQKKGSESRSFFQLWPPFIGFGCDFSPENPRRCLNEKGKIEPCVECVFGDRDFLLTASQLDGTLESNSPMGTFPLPLLTAEGEPLAVVRNNVVKCDYYTEYTVADAPAVACEVNNAVLGYLPVAFLESHVGRTIGLGWLSTTDAVPYPLPPPPAALAA